MNDSSLLQKIDRFVRKYYRNRLIRGSLFLLAFLGGAYFVLVMLEFLFHFNQFTRALFLFSYISVALFLLFRFVLIPLLQILKIGKQISYDQAAEIIGAHFSDIQDKLLNTLQLIHQQKSAAIQSPLLEASIDQKVNKLKVFQFATAINFGKNLKYLKYVSIPLIFIIVLAIVSPKTISDPTRRIIRFNKNFLKEVPFRIEILNKQLTVIQQEDLELRIKLYGEQIPVEIFITTGGTTYKMQRNKDFIYSYTFRALQNDISFKFSAGTFLSENFIIKVYPKPIILNFDVRIDYPSYIEKSPEAIENTGDLIIPMGSVISWKFYTKDVDVINLNFLDNKVSLQKRGTNVFLFSRKFLSPTSYSVIPKNKFSLKVDSLCYKILIINDGFPSVTFSETVDSTEQTALFFKGTIKDDYGFTKLTFNYTTSAQGDSIATKITSVNIPFNKAVNNQNFYYACDPSKLIPKNGDKISYFFEVWDNDGINGSKSTRSERHTLASPTKIEVERQTDNNEKKIKNSLVTSIQETESIRKSIDDLNRRMTEKKDISWQEKRKLEELIKSNERILQNLDGIKEKNLENIKNEERYLNPSERILEKQRQLNELMDQLLTDEFKKAIQEMKKLLEQADKSKIGELIEKMKSDNMGLETQLDRNLELFKQIEFERKMEDLVGSLNRNAERQDNLAEKNEKLGNTENPMKDEQKEIKNTSDSISKIIQQLKEDSKGIEIKPDMAKAEQKQDSITKKLEKIEMKMNGNGETNQSKDQKAAAQKMKELASEMEESMQGSEEEQLEEDASNIRMIMENLLRLSFEQEELIQSTGLMVRNDPKYITIVERQKEMRDKLQVVEDSLNSIAKRQVVIQPVISREIASINRNIQSAVESIINRRTAIALAQQQYSMTAINNLTLLLNESLEKMNQQMSMSMSGKGKKSSCQKPSNSKGKGSMKNLKSMQQKLGEQLQQLKNGMEKSKENGKGNKTGESLFSKQIAKMAAEQEALRNEMQKYRDDLLDQGIKDGGGVKDAMKDMDMNETDLINKRISQETLQRQQRIITRMLESEKAEQLREKDEKRESTEAKNVEFSNPFSNFKYKIKQRADLELLQLTPPALNGFYKSKVNTYILKIDN